MALPSRLAGRLAVRCSQRIDDVAIAWRRLETFGLFSPGQSLDFTRLWVETQRIAPADQFYLMAELDGVPLALLPLQRHSVLGFKVLTWFPGAHVGAVAPLIDRVAFATLPAEERKAVWRSLFAAVNGIDVLYLRNMPEPCPASPDFFAGTGTAQASDILYRAEFSSWHDADLTQRNKSRRKHDRQQGDKLAALGTVDFEEVTGGPDAKAVLDIMFSQRSARFRQMGVADPFTEPCVRDFYYRATEPLSGVPVRLHVLRLDGAVVAVRYNIALGDTLYCLISSMSVEPRLQPGSPGKQCLLRVMQTIFEQGWGVFDMGAGLADEKRHWCNVQVQLSHRYVPLNRRGAVIASLHRNWQGLRRRIKTEERPRELLRRARVALSHLARGGAKGPGPDAR